MRGKLKSIFLKIRALRNVINTECQRIVSKDSPSKIIKALQLAGIDISDSVVYFGDNIHIDMTRPSLVHIGSKTFLHNGLNILTHDYATHVFLNKYNEFIPSSGPVWIGENVWFGENVTVLKGSTIGDNCIIGIGSVVMGEIPKDSVAAGCPAKVICSLDEYFNKRKKVCLEEALTYARSIYSKSGKKPEPKDFWEEFPLFVSGNQVYQYPEIPIRKQLGDSFEIWKNNHKAPFSSFDDFLKAAGIS